jgi:hypothetical protein
MKLFCGFHCFDLLSMCSATFSSAGPSEVLEQHSITMILEQLVYVACSICSILLKSEQVSIL